MNFISHFTTQRAISKETQELSTRILDSVNDPDSKVGEGTALSILPSYSRIVTEEVDGNTSYSCDRTKVNPHTRASYQKASYLFNEHLIPTITKLQRGIGNGPETTERRSSPKTAEIYDDAVDALHQVGDLMGRFPFIFLRPDGCGFASEIDGVPAATEAKRWIAKAEAMTGVRVIDRETDADPLTASDSGTTKARTASVRSQS